ncbi:MAG: class I SAM-dependent methyltransferase [Acidisphaera sp.]|nr:class I SAM-dependent methyltransferase [Acidisphaera sp.]
MNDWSTGYVSDVGYIRGVYRQQSPLHLDIACLLGGTSGVNAASAAELSYVELGCGQGLGALTLAASNPHWQVTGVDLLPAHVAEARDFAREAGLDNVRFLEADLLTLAEDPLSAEIPQADVVSLHGLWSWVSPPIRAGIVRLLRAKVRPGGIVHVSYNALPGWQGALGMQRVLRESGLRLASRTDLQAKAGLEVVRELFEAKAASLVNEAYVKHVLGRTVSGAYLSHEYMNEGWAPCFHADVAAAMAQAKLEWVASGQLLENFTELMLDAKQRAVLDRFEEPVMRELVKDICVPRGLRHDVFVRGARRLDTATRDAALGDIVLALSRSPESFVFEAKVPAGKAGMSLDFYQPVVAALAERPMRVREILDLPEAKGRGAGAELVGMLIGTDQAVPATLRQVGQHERGVRFNRTAARRLGGRPDVLSTAAALVAGEFGTALPCPGLELLVFDRLHEGAAADPAALAARLTTDPGERRTLEEAAGRIIAQSVPAWRSLGLL